MKQIESFPTPHAAHPINESEIFGPIIGNFPLDERGLAEISGN
jgi:hypothetical protein